MSASERRKTYTEGDDCACNGYDDDCATCDGSGWIYTTYADCDHCGAPVALEVASRPVWMRDGVPGPVVCGDCGDGGRV